MYSENSTASKNHSHEFLNLTVVFYDRHCMRYRSLEGIYVTDPECKYNSEPLRSKYKFQSQFLCTVTNLFTLDNPYKTVYNCLLLYTESFTNVKFSHGLLYVGVLLLSTSGQGMFTHLFLSNISDSVE